MVLDVGDWRRVEQQLDPEWTLVPRDRDRFGQPVKFDVRTTKSKAVAAGLEPDWKGSVTLARWLMGASKPSERVTFRDGDPTNLRRRNLVVTAPPVKAPRVETRKATTQPSRMTLKEAKAVLKAQHSD